jgi:hypothetical protein
MASLIATVRTQNGRQITTCPISSAQNPIQRARPTSHRNCSNAIPVTRLGKISGPSVFARTNALPENSWRWKANASGTPAAAEINAVSVASSRLNNSGCDYCGPNAALHHCSEKLAREPRAGQGRSLRSPHMNIAPRVVQLDIDSSRPG